MLTLYVTRHGETEWNIEKRMQGWNDSPLTEKGRKDAIRLGKRMEDIELTAIYTSTSGRALETARLVRGERLIPIYEDERWREIHLGDWEGKTHEEIGKFDAIGFHYFWNEPHLYKPTRGETFSDVQQRAFAALESIIERHASGDILIVTHAVVLKALTTLLKNAPLERLWDPPYIYGTSVTTIQVENGAMTLLSEGDASHIEEVRHV
ncbi:histidine phosphatase family protein [Anoxybacteroides tepidamans]|uniref:histidine phosphatase family protein n=1 Tax=Anoxybacteroides tepidamans TaxID=265948 RepID=UPI00047F5089|nr:histidine phosphatase family protein [Anoxybacillus tepidamans]